MRADGTETYYFNSQLFTKFITNVQRSGVNHLRCSLYDTLLILFQKMFENVTLQVAWRTPLEKLDQLEKYMNDWLATEENRWFEPNTAVTLQKIDYQRCLEFTMAVGHNGYAKSVIPIIIRIINTSAEHGKTGVCATSARQPSSLPYIFTVGSLASHSIIHHNPS